MGPSRPIRRWPQPIESQQSVALDPELAPLLSRFVEQCRDTLAGVMTALEAGFQADKAQLGLVQNMAHSLAGLAATFAAPQLVSPAPGSDLALDANAPETTRKVLLDMEAALQAYLAGLPTTIAQPAWTSSSAIAAS